MKQCIDDAQLLFIAIRFNILMNLKKKFLKHTILWIFFFFFSNWKKNFFNKQSFFLFFSWKQIRSQLILSWSETTVNSMMKFHLHNCRWLNMKRIGPCLISPVLVYYRDINPLLSGIWKGNVNQIVAWNYASKWIMIVPGSYLNFLCRSFHKNSTI